MIKINKTKARRLYNEGTTIYLLPSNVSWHKSLTIWIQPTLISLDNNKYNETFDLVVNYFERYNCDHERGYYSHYYIEE